MLTKKVCKKKKLNQLTERPVKFTAKDGRSNSSSSNTTMKMKLERLFIDIFIKVL